MVLFRNNQCINNLFKTVHNYVDIFNAYKHYNFDENILSAHLKNTILDSDEYDIEVYWPEQIVVGMADLILRPRGWFWKDGKIFGPEGKERCYLHFMRWKKNNKMVTDFSLEDNPSEFSITPLGFWSKELKFGVRLKLELDYLVKAVLSDTPLRWNSLRKHKIRPFLKKYFRSQDPLDEIA